MKLIKKKDRKAEQTEENPVGKHAGKEETPQTKKARQLLAQGVHRMDVADLTDLDFTQVDNLKYRMKIKGQIPVKQLPRGGYNPLEPLSGPVKTGLMTEEDVRTYGAPKQVKIDKIPRVFELQIGPVGVSIAGQAVDELLKEIKAIEGVEDVTITVRSDIANGRML
jgi:hypothetical protein